MGVMFAFQRTGGGGGGGGGGGRRGGGGGGGGGDAVVQPCSMELFKLVLCSTAKEYVVPSIPSYNLLFSR